MFDISGRLTVITGGTSGIGRAVAERFIKAGSTVVAFNVVDDSAVAKEIGCHFKQVDVSDENIMRNIFRTVEQEFGKIDCLINNAGIGDVGPDIGEMPLEMVHRLTAVNQHGVFLGLKYGAPHLQDGGSIINTSSLASRLAIAGQSAYSATKAAVEILTKSAATELGHRAIRVNAIAPAYVATDLGSGEMGDELCKVLTALGRQATVDDLTGVYHFLASEESRYMTGQTLIVDGGWRDMLTPQLVSKITGSTQAPS